MFFQQKKRGTCSTNMGQSQTPVRGHDIYILVLFDQDIANLR